ncbi:MAG: fluoride efflux transporter FluC [Saccharofermentanales bacterium]
MRKLLFIGACGAIGAVGRFLIKEIPSGRFSGILPLGTLFINFTGCLALAVFLAFAARKQNFDPVMKAGISIGLLGAFTTFSTVCKEAFDFINNGYLFTAALYIVVTIIAGLSAIYAGTAFMQYESEAQ